MTTLQRLYAEYGRSPWLDDLTRSSLPDGIRRVTANPTIFTEAVVGSADYDEQFAALTAAGCPVGDAHWQLVVDHIPAALAAKAGRLSRC